jgi:SPASM domain peptide maturase of grasp-with-spasm system
MNRSNGIKIPQTLPFKMYACCIPVKGYSRSIIYDLNRSQYSYIPNSLFNIIKEDEGQTVEKIKNNLSSKDKSTVDKYFSFLMEKEYVFFCANLSELNLFPNISVSYFTPSTISNAILQIKDVLKINLPKLIEDLTDLGCSFIQITFHGNESLGFVTKILKYFINSRFRSIEILLKYNDLFSDYELIQLVRNHRRIHHLLIYNAPHSRILKQFHMEMQAISYNKQSLGQSLQSAIKDTTSFRTNVALFCESQEFNSYFNQKVVIDINGMIKNVPNSNLNFGNLNDVSLQNIVKTKRFQALWKVKKDIIEICKECEYRYMCMDNRIPKKRGNKWIHEESCNYNIHLNQWNVSPHTNQP